MSAYLNSDREPVFLQAVPRGDGSDRCKSRSSFLCCPVADSGLTTFSYGNKHSANLMNEVVFFTRRDSACRRNELQVSAHLTQAVRYLTSSLCTVAGACAGMTVVNQPIALSVISAIFSGGMG